MEGKPIRNGLDTPGCTGCFLTGHHPFFGPAGHCFVYHACICNRCFVFAALKYEIDVSKKSRTPCSHTETSVRLIAQQSKAVWSNKKIGVSKLDTPIGPSGET